MALVLIEQANPYQNWQGPDVHKKQLQLPSSGGSCEYKIICDEEVEVYIFDEIYYKNDSFWQALSNHLKGNIYVYIHFGGGGAGKDVLPQIRKQAESAELSTGKGKARIKHISYYSIGTDDPKGISQIYEKSKNESKLDSAKLIEIFKKKGFVKEKIRQTKEIENQQLHIAALLLLLKVNQKSMKAVSNLLANLKECLSAMKQEGIDTTNLASYLDSKPLNDLLPEVDMREMEKECRKILQILEGKKLSLETDKQHAH